MAYAFNGGRHHHRRTIIVPPTTDMALVFPLDHENKRFDKGFYSSSLTDGRASSEQIERFLKEVEEAFKAKLKWVRRLKGYLLFSLITGLFIITMYTLIVMSGIDDDSYSHIENNTNHNASHKAQHGGSKHLRHNNHNSTRHQVDPEEQLDTLFLVWIGGFINALVWAIILKVVKKHSIKKARKGVQAVVDKNQALFANTGLRWNLPLAFPHYIELWKDYKGQNYVQANAQPALNYNSLNYQIQNQAQPQSASPRYPNLNQVLDQHAYLDFQNNGITVRPLLPNQVQRNDTNSYVPPYPVNFVSNV